METNNSTPVKVETNLPAIKSGWGVAENLDQADLFISKLHHQQAISQNVKNGKAIPGEWCDSVSGDVLCKKDEPLKLIVFSNYKNILVSKWDDKRQKYLWQKTIPLTPENANLEFRCETPEGKMQHQIQYNYFCLVVDRLTDMPYVLSLSSTKTKTAKKLNTLCGKLAQINLPSAQYVFELSTITETKGSDSWLGLDVKQGREATKEELETAFKWYNKIKAKNVIVADSKEADNETASDDTDGDDIPF